MGVERSDEKAAEWYRKAAEQGVAKAQACLAECYFIGRGVEKSCDEIVKWTRAAAEQGDSSAALSLFNYYAIGLHIGGGHINCSTEESIRWLMIAAKQGSAEAQYHLAGYYASGTGGCEKNQEEAFKLLKSAAKKGYKDARDELIEVCGEDALED